MLELILIYKVDFLMNKKMFATSMALVLAMTMVLAVGKTSQVENVDEVPVVDQVTSVEQAAPKQLAVVVPMVAAETKTQVKPTRAVIIPAELDESQMILNAGEEPAPAISQAVPHPLVRSMARVEEALQHLEQVAADAHLSVAALEQQYTLR